MALDNAHQAVEYVTSQGQGQDDGIVHDLGAVELHASLPTGTRVACAGSNFITHRERMTAGAGGKWKSRTSGAFGT